MVEPTNIPSAWSSIETETLQGALLVVGAADVGKSTFARYLYHRLASPAAYLDGDPGQSSLGPPTTMTVVVSQGNGGLSYNEAPMPVTGLTWRTFVGSTTPRGHMLPMLTGAALLVRVAQEAGASSVVYDTCGLVDPAIGGLTLKLALIDLLRPSVVFAIQRERELEPLLLPLRRTKRTRLVELRASSAVVRRSQPARQAHRREQFAAYFKNARTITLKWSTIAVLPYPSFSLNRLVAFEDASGFTLALGIVQGIDRGAGQLTLLTPLASLEGVDALRLGDLSLDPETYRDRFEHR